MTFLQHRISLILRWAIYFIEVARHTYKGRQRYTLVYWNAGNLEDSCLISLNFLYKIDGKVICCEKQLQDRGWDLKDNGNSLQ